MPYTLPEIENYKHLPDTGTENFVSPKNYDAYTLSEQCHRH